MTAKLVCKSLHDRLSHKFLHTNFPVHFANFSKTTDSYFEKLAKSLMGYFFGAPCILDISYTETFKSLKLYFTD